MSIRVNKRLIRAVLVLLITSALLMQIAVLASAAVTINDAVLDAQYGVVRVITDNYVGTGFFVGRANDPATIIVTNSHVVDGQSTVQVTVTDYYGAINAKVIYDNKVKNDGTIVDLAILKLDTSISGYKTLPLSSPKEMYKTQPVYAIGFPGIADHREDPLLSDIDHLTITDGIASNPNHRYKGIDYIFSNITINGGNSGGPMVDEFGRVVGINTSITQLDSDGKPQRGNKMTLALSADYVIEALDKLELPYEIGLMPDEQSEPDGQETDDDAAKDDNKDEKDSKDFEINWTYVAIGLAAVGVIVAAIMLITRNKPRSKPGKAFCQKCGRPIPLGHQLCESCIDSFAFKGDTAPTMPKKLVVVCEKGTAKGKMAVSENKVRVGRNPASCDLLFPASSPGVSREHCEIAIVSNGIQITDLNSTYGTFLSNGKRIYGSCHIQEGEYIMLGSKSNIISVSIKHIM